MHTPRGEVLVLGPDSSFQLKLIPLSPYEFTGAGMEISSSSEAIEEIRSSPEYGMRALEESDIKRITMAVEHGAGASDALRQILSKTPLSLEDLSSSSASHILQGPVLLRPDLSSLGSTVLGTQKSLDRATEKAFRARYPLRAGMYV